MSDGVWLPQDDFDALTRRAEQADKLAETLDDLLASVPPRHSHPHEEEQWERAQVEAAAVLAGWKQVSA